MRAWVVGLLLALLLGSDVRADGGVVVGYLTFHPPAGVAVTTADGIAGDEIWAGTGERPVLALSRAPAPRTGLPPVTVIRLLDIFAEPAARLRSRVWREPVAGFGANCVEATGTWLDRTQDPQGIRRPAHTLLAAVIDTPGGQVVARLLAPAEQARALGPAFWAMVRGAMPAAPS